MIVLQALKFILRPLRAIVCLVLMTGCHGWSQGAIVWNGPVISFNHPDGSGTSVQDQLTPAVWLTRDTSQGLINDSSETAYTHNFSPQDTEWAYGSLTDYSSLTYLN